jgi:hypothetical protein
MSASELSRRDRVYIELAVRRVDFALDGRVPWRRRRLIRDELRSNLVEAARDAGGRAAVEKLGDLHQLAGSYLELYRGRFDFQTGSYWALAMYVAIQIVGIAVIVAFHAGLAAGSSQGASFSFEPLKGFGPYSGSVSGNGSGFMMTIFSPAHALLMLVAWAIGSSYRSVFGRR